jgi:hypothetical protein
MLSQITHANCILHPPLLVFLKFSSTAFGTSTPITVEFGIWYYESLAAISTTDGNYIVEYCQAYPDTVEIDASWKAARAFSVLVFIFACIIVGTLLYASCFPARAGHSLGRCMPPLYLLMAIFQGLTLLFLDSAACKANPLLDGLGSIIFQDTCTISTGAKSESSNDHHHCRRHPRRRQRRWRRSIPPTAKMTYPMRYACDYCRPAAQGMQSTSQRNDDLSHEIRLRLLSACGSGDAVDVAAQR